MKVICFSWMWYSKHLNETRKSKNEEAVLKEFLEVFLHLPKRYFGRTHEKVL